MSAARRATLLVATGNPGKLRELEGLLADLPLALRGLRDFPQVRLPDEGDDYVANALGKARSAAAQTRLPTLADDSGIEVAGLGGGPGPRSARYGGAGLDDAGRVRHLLHELAGRTGAARAARFFCVAALALPDGESRHAFGACPGRVLEAPRGRGGFGYDPVFWSSELDACLAEVGEARKAEVSHRARAVRALRPWLVERVCGPEALSAQAP